MRFLLCIILSILLWQCGGAPRKYPLKNYPKPSHQKYKPPKIEEPHSKSAPKASKKKPDYLDKFSSGIGDSRETFRQRQQDRMKRLKKMIIHRRKIACMKSWNRIHITWNPSTKTPALIEAQDLRVLLLPCADTLRTSLTSVHAPKAAQAVLQLLKKIYKTDTEFQLQNWYKDDLQYTHVHFKSFIKKQNKDIPVLLSRVSVHFDHQDHIYAVSGHLWNDKGIKSLTLPTVQDATKQTSRYLQKYMNKSLSTSSRKEAFKIEKVFPSAYAIQKQLTLGYSFIVTTYGKHKYHYFFDANTRVVHLVSALHYSTSQPTSQGKKTLIHGQLLRLEKSKKAELEVWYNKKQKLYYLYNKSNAWSVWTTKANGEQLDHCYTHSQANWGEKQAAAFSIAYHLNQALHYFKKVHRYLGWNGTSAKSIAIVDYPHDQPNAFYLGEGIFAFGDAHNTQRSLGTSQIVAHEFAHAVIENISQLSYQGESGAIHESFADIFAVLIHSADWTKVHQSNSTLKIKDWSIGKAILGSKARDLSRVYSAKDQVPTTTRYKGSAWIDVKSQLDYGGIHHNSAVHNFFFYLLMMGGTGTNDGIRYKVSGIGRVAAEKLAFRTLKTYTHPASTFQDIRQAWIRAAFDLDRAEKTTHYRKAVRAAWDAVGVSDYSCLTTYRDADQDGFGDRNHAYTQCPSPAGYVLNHDDCDDRDANIYPNEKKVCAPHSEKAFP